MKYLACVTWVLDGNGDPTDTCATQAWVEQPSMLPPLTVAEARDIGQAALIAFACVMAVKVAFKKSQ
jgi:hypothetical protein